MHFGTQELEIFILNRDGERERKKNEIYLDRNQMVKNK